MIAKLKECGPAVAVILIIAVYVGLLSPGPKYPDALKPKAS